MKDVMTPELLQKMEIELNPKIKYWHYLAHNFDVTVDMLQAFGRLEEERKSPTEELLQHLVSQDRSPTLKDLLKALENIQRYDAIQIITRKFPDTVGESKIFLVVTLYLPFSISLV